MPIRLCAKSIPSRATSTARKTATSRRRNRSRARTYRRTAMSTPAMTPGQAPGEGVLARVDGRRAPVGLEGEELLAVRARVALVLVQDDGRRLEGQRGVGIDGIRVRLDDVDARGAAVRRRAEDVDHLGGEVVADPAARRAGQPERGLERGRSAGPGCRSPWRPSGPSSAVVRDVQPVLVEVGHQGDARGPGPASATVAGRVTPSSCRRRRLRRPWRAPRRRRRRRRPRRPRPSSTRPISLPARRVEDDRERRGPAGPSSTATIVAAVAGHVKQADRARRGS